MPSVDWSQLAQFSSLRSVIDPLDIAGTKNALVDAVHWNAIEGVIDDHLEAVLDVGCGIGRFSTRLKRFSTSYIGMDPSLDMVRAAMRSRRDGESYVCGTGVTIPFQDRLFDACLCCYVYQYLSKTSSGYAMLRELQRVMKPAGRLILLEQATAIGLGSGTVSVGSTVEDYVSVVSKFFVVDSVSKVRLSRLSLISYKTVMLLGNRGRLRPALIRFAAAIERLRASRATDRALRKVNYYDVLIAATPR